MSEFSNLLNHGIGQENRKDLFVFIVHIKTDRISNLYSEICEYFEGHGDVVPVRFVKDKWSCGELEINGEQVLTIDNQDLFSLTFPLKCPPKNFSLIPGNSDLIELFLARRFKGAPHVWRMECDVAYTGKLGELIENLSIESADLICTRSRIPKFGWQHHNSIYIPKGWPVYSVEDPIVFLPFLRASARLIAAIDQFYSEGGRGHHEWTWPYVARTMNYQIIDIGGAGPYTPERYRNRYYPAPTAFRRPTFDARYVKQAPGALPNALWHPVKDWSPAKPRPISESATGHFLRHIIHTNPSLRQFLLKAGFVK